MASNRVTPSPDGEKYPLDSMNQYTLDREPTREQLYHPEHYQQEQERHHDQHQGLQNKTEIVIGGKHFTLKRHILHVNI